jgi:acyl transferase domain-containing protein
MDEAHGGGMAAVIGVGVEAIRAELAAAGVSSIDVANFNAPTQTVLAGPVEDLDRLGARFAAPARVVPLNVRTAFHSRYVRGIKDAFAAFVADVTFRPLLLPVISNFTALPYRDDEIAHNLVQQIDHSVRWVEIVQYILQEPDAQFEEIGPGQVLTRLVEDIRQRPVPVNIRRIY